MKLPMFQLDQDLVFNQWVQPVKLPTAGFDPSAGTITTTSGWGTTSVSLAVILTMTSIIKL